LRRIACRHASKQGVNSMAAKPSSAKTARKTKKKTKKAKARPDPCQALRDRLEMIDQQILDLVDAIGDPDIPEKIKKGLRAALKRLRALRTQILAELKKCEAKNP
jgi:hypothetical protein